MLREKLSKSATSVIEMYLREIIIFGVQNCSFHEMIISDNTERGSLKPKKSA